MGSEPNIDRATGRFGGTPAVCPPHPEPRRDSLATVTAPMMTKLDPAELTAIVWTGGQRKKAPEAQAAGA